jgi:glycerophosphoryl diester phosphodiesterase
VSSFDLALLGAFRIAAPRVAAGVLFAADQAWELREWLGAALRPSAVHPDVRLATDGRIAAWKRRGLAVNVWTVDDPGEVARLARAGADGVVSNAPGMAREVVRRATGR